MDWRFLLLCAVCMSDSTVMTPQICNDTLSHNIAREEVLHDVARGSKRCFTGLFCVRICHPVCMAEASDASMESTFRFSLDFLHLADMYDVYAHLPQIEI